MIWTNQKVTLTKDLFFGLCVLTDEGWIPMTELLGEEIEEIRRLIDNDPSFPRDWAILQEVAEDSPMALVDVTIH